MTVSSSSKEVICSAVEDIGRKFGYQHVKPHQMRAVVDFVRGSDVFVSLPTGSGKSFCFWCLPDVIDRIKGKSGESLVLVVSPLLALMADQVASLSSQGVSAVHVTNDLEEAIVEKFMMENFKYCFLALKFYCKTLPGVNCFFHLYTIKNSWFHCG